MCKVRQAAMAVLLFGSGLLAAEPGRTQQIENFDATWQEGRWQFHNGGEFPGAKARSSVARTPRTPATMAAS